MKKMLQPVRGTKDLIGKDARLFNYVISKSLEVFESYGYSPIHTPIFEFTDVFKRSLGDFSDVVSKEMYNLEDRGGESLTLRPEFTASIVRALISNGMHHNLPLRLYTHGPLFRYERPQKGRQRQFHQLNIECLGLSSPNIDGEVITMAQDVLKKLGINDSVELQVNSLGCTESRKLYLTALTEYFSKYKADLSQSSQERLQKNPLRILDSKDSKDKEISINAPKIGNYYTKDSKEFFDSLLNYLTVAGVEYKINPNLVRGLDYYCHTSFEFITNTLGAQGTVLGGGRYDGLSTMLGGPEVPGIGFGAGIERISLMVKEIEDRNRPNIMVSLGDNKSSEESIQLSRKLRDAGIRIIEDFDYSMNKRLKRANKINAKLAIFIGDEEIAQNIVKIKNLDDGSQVSIDKDKIISELKRILAL